MHHTFKHILFCVAEWQKVPFVVICYMLWADTVWVFLKLVPEIYVLGFLFDIYVLGYLSQNLCLGFLDLGFMLPVVVSLCVPGFA